MEPSLLEGINSEIFLEADPILFQKFLRFHEKNPNLWIRFRALSFEVKATKRKRYSAWTIINVLRWEHDVRTQGDVFKISNDFIALYARLMIATYPEFDGFFEIKKMKRKRRHFSQEELMRTAK